MKKLYIGIIATAVTVGMLATGIFVGCVAKNFKDRATSHDVNINGINSSETVNNGKEASYIGEEAAKKIALDKAELKESEVKFVKVELDRDDGIYIYDVEFWKDRVEYTAEIKADDGKILDWDVDLDD